MDFTGMPPMVVQWGGRELFSQQIREFCSRAENAGIRVLRDADADMSHTYQMLIDLIGARSERGLDRLATMVAHMVVEEMGSDGRGGGPGPKSRSTLAQSFNSSRPTTPKSTIINDSKSSGETTPKEMSLADADITATVPLEAVVANLSLAQEKLAEPENMVDILANPVAPVRVEVASAS
jgi:hypothetical protein